MQNVTATVKGNRLILEIDLSPRAQKEARPSDSGKTKLIASTGGFQPVNGIAGGIKFTVLATMPNG